MVNHFLRMKVFLLVDLQEYAVVFPVPSRAEQYRRGRLQDTAGQCLVASAASCLLRLTEKTFLEVERREGEPGLV